MGEFYALLTAAFWAGAVICFKRAGEVLPPLALNLFRVAVSSVLLVITAAVMGHPPWQGAPARHLLLILASGTIAIAVADTFFHAALNRVGAGISAVIDCLYPPATAVFAMLLLGERLSRGDVVGMVLVVGAVLVTTRVAPPAGISRRTLLAGILLGCASMGALSLGIVIVKPVLTDGRSVIWVTTMRQLAALAVLALAAVRPPQRREYARILRLDRQALAFALPGTLLGSYLALMFWIAGMKYTQAGAAAALNQTAIVYIILLARLVLGEPLTRRRLTACGLAVAGVFCVVLG
jgi:drug/metabolite transporter (DMT)-like permease